MTRDENTFEIVAAMIKDVLGNDWDPELCIRPDTSFSEDLELESIEFVALAEKLQAKYGSQVDFVAWISEKELDELIGMKVGQVSEYIDQCLSSRRTG